MLGAADPDFLAADEIALALAARKGGDARGVGATVGLGHAEGLQAQLATRQLWQVTRLLFRRAVLEQRTHGVHLGVAGTAVAARAVNLLEYRGRRLDAEPGAAVLFRDQYRQEARARQRRDELARVTALAIELAPVFPRKALTQLSHRLADIRESVIVHVRFLHD